MEPTRKLRSSQPTVKNSKGVYYIVNHSDWFRPSSLVVLLTDIRVERVKGIFTRSTPKKRRNFRRCQSDGRDNFPFHMPLNFVPRVLFSVMKKVFIILLQGRSCFFFFSLLNNSYRQYLHPKPTSLIEPPKGNDGLVLAKCIGVYQNEEASYGVVDTVKICGRVASMFSHIPPKIQEVFEQSGNPGIHRGGLFFFF